VTDPSRAVFLSYASQDARAAQQLCKTLRSTGVEVWFDQSELRGGDAWDASIRQQIKGCYLFVPIISANTQLREEGYFRREWNLAVARTLDMAEDRAFLLPIVIDDTSDSEARVPEKFRDVQWTRLPGGANADTFVEHVRRLLAPDATTPAATRVQSSAPPRSTSGAASARSRHPAFRSFMPWIAGGLLIVVTGYLLADKFLTSKRPMPATAVPADAPAPAEVVNEKSVAVLPFVDMSEKKDQEYFSDGLSEELIDMLTKVADLRVPARTSSFYFKGKQTTIADIAKVLRVAQVLEGSVRKSGNRLRVTAQLVRADNGYHLWSETYDRELDDIFKIQDEIAGAVVKALKVTLLEAGTTRTAPTANTEAYSLFMQARALIRRGTQTDTALAVNYLERAIELDPKFALAWARLTQARTFQYELGALPYEEAIVEARRAAQHAIELDSTLAAAHLSMARVHNFEWNWNAAEAEIQRARQLDPGDADALRWAAIIPLTSGRAYEAISLIQRAVELDPLNPANHSILGATYFAMGNYAEAELAYRKAIELAPPRGFGSSGSLAIVLLATGRPTEALALIERQPDEDTRLWGTAVVSFALGRKADSNSAVADLERRFAGTNAFDIAEIHAYRGDTDDAFMWLDRAYQQHATGFLAIKHDFLLAKLRGDPRYKMLLRKINLTE
jgi:TolB-like protein/Tfp pilus assembly protein PilF